MKNTPGEDCYEYIAVHVDYLLAIVTMDPGAICKIFTEKYNFKLKGVGPIEYHLGCHYTKDPDGTLVSDPQRYIEKMRNPRKQSHQLLLMIKPNLMKGHIISRLLLDNCNG